jgi:hypothetical protein
VMMIAITPSLKAFSRSGFILSSSPLHCMSSAGVLIQWSGFDDRPRLAAIPYANVKSKAPLATLTC